jgi:hypothetical protein
MNEPPVESEQRIVIGADPRRWRIAGNGLIEHTARRYPIDVFAADAESDDSPGKYVDHHEDPVAAKQDRLAAKEIDAPETVFGMRKEGQPGRTRGIWVSASKVLREHAAYNILIDLDTEGVCNLLRNPLIAESGVTTLHVDDRGDEFLGGTFRAGFSSNSC